MLILSLSCLGIVVASADASDRRVVQRLAHRGYDELIDELAGLERPMRCWISPLEVALQMCNQLEETRVALATLVAEGGFRHPVIALSSLSGYSAEWTTMFVSTPMTTVIAWARGQIDMTVAARMVAMITEYTTLLNTECGFRFLPPTLQRFHDRVLGQSNPPDFRIITDGLTGGQLAHFPDSVVGDVFTPITTTFGQVTRGNRSWYYDIERQCTVVSVTRRAIVIPELHVAVYMTQDMNILDANSKIIVWFHNRRVEVSVGEILGVTGPLPIIDFKVDKVRMHGENRHFTFLVSVRDGDETVTKLIMFDAFESRKFEEHPVNALNTEFRIDGGFALVESNPGFAVPLLPNAEFEGHYPEPQPRRFRKVGQFLMDGNHEYVLDKIEQWMIPVNEWADDHDIVNFRDNPDYTEEQKLVLEIYDCFERREEESQVCRNFIDTWLTGKPDSSRAIESLVDRAFGLPDRYELTTLEEILP